MQHVDLGSVQCTVPKVDELELAGARVCEENVLGLHVAVDDTEGVAVGESAEKLAKQPARLSGGWKIMSGASSRNMS